MDHLRSFGDFAARPELATYFFWINVQGAAARRRARAPGASAGDRPRVAGEIRDARGAGAERGPGAGRRRRLRRPAQPDLRSGAGAAPARRGRLRPGPSAAADHAALQHGRGPQANRRGRAADVEEAPRRARSSSRTRNGRCSSRRLQATGLPDRAPGLGRRLPRPVHVPRAARPRTTATTTRTGATPNTKACSRRPIARGPRAAPAALCIAPRRSRCPRRRCMPLYVYTRSELVEAVPDGALHELPAAPVFQVLVDRPALVLGDA